MAFKTVAIKEEKFDQTQISLTVGYIIKKEGEGTPLAYIHENNDEKAVQIQPHDVKPGLYVFVTNVCENETSEDQVPCLMRIDGKSVGLNVEYDDKSKWNYIGKPVEIYYKTCDNYPYSLKVKIMSSVQKPCYDSFGTLESNQQNLFTEKDINKKINKICKAICDYYNRYVYFCGNGVLKTYECEYRQGDPDTKHVPILRCNKANLFVNYK